MTHKPSVAAKQAVLDSLADGPLTRRQIEQVSGYSYTVISYALQDLLDEKKIYIPDWVDAREPKFDKGNFPNKKAPRARSAAERQRRYREKLYGQLSAKRRYKDGHL